MRASARFYDWREYGFELVLKVRLQTGPLFFHVEDPQMGLLLEMAFLTLDIALGIHGFRSPRYLESGRNHFLESTFSSHFEEECYKNCSKLRSHLRRSQRNAAYCFWYKARPIDTIAFLIF